MSTLLRASVKILRWSVTFETDCQPAFRYLSDMPAFFDWTDYRFIPNEIEATNPIVCYKDSPQYKVGFLAHEKKLVVQAPFCSVKNYSQALAAINSSNLIVPIWRATEIQRQAAAEYFFHTSAVVRSNRGILLSGPRESGKTSIAFDLCKNYGFSFYSNDQTVAGLYQGEHSLLLGDDAFRFRASSLKMYPESVLTPRVESGSP